MTVMDARVRKDWNRLIDDVVAGRWVNPETGRPADVPCRSIVLAETFDGAESDLLAPLDLGERLAVVSDTNTVEAAGRRIGERLRSRGPVDEVVLRGDLKPTMAEVERLRERTRDADALVAVGSGSLTDTCKYATFLDGRPFATFGTAASMNGYAASTASITLPDGVKASLPAHAPRGVFLDLGVSADAPGWLTAAGLGDSLCRPTAQTDWWVSHRLFGTSYTDVPYQLQADDEPIMLDRAGGLASRSVDAVGALQRVLTLCGLGVCFTGTSHHGSMGEHLISHWIDMFAGAAHPGTVHGQQVGVASIAMATLQARLLDREAPPVVRPTAVDWDDWAGLYGADILDQFRAETAKKALDEDGARALNQRLGELWPSLRREVAAFSLPVDGMKAALRSSGGPTTYAELGLTAETWRRALKGARHLRARWSFLDLADDAGLLDGFIEEEIAA